MKKVLITRRTHPKGVALLQAETNVSELLNPSREQLRQALPGVNGIVAGVAVMYDSDLLDSAPDLLVVARHGVGLDNVNLKAATERGICVLYTPRAMITSVAEHAVGFMLALARSYKRGDAALKEDKYHTRDQLGAVDLQGKTLAIIGCGRIGSRVSQICSQGLGMRVITYDPYISAEQARRAGAELWPHLDDVLRSADVVTLHTPLTPETRHMISHAQLALMKPSAYLINTARGAVADEAAVLAALQSGRIAGFGADVFETEPTVSGNPLFHLPNAVVTPHSAGSSAECMQRIADTVARGMLAVFHGEHPGVDCMANPEVWEQRRTVG
jgi:D-3-phosphoglycerate dehydrogenase / 2-oxoglutarate reductase